MIRILGILLVEIFPILSLFHFYLTDGDRFGGGAAASSGASIICLKRVFLRQNKKFQVGF